jgi:hypothetical protein
MNRSKNNEANLPRELSIQRSIAHPVIASISEMNLSNWFHGGYHDWVRHQAKSQVFKQHLPALLVSDSVSTPSHGRGANGSGREPTVPAKGQKSLS